ncbi:MAG: hypothetical protein IJH34_05375, partial [Romboutsia sp.]|nr:hypothetical protein [Romboutsia sp.]
MIQKNEELQGIRKNPYGRKFNEKIIEDVNSIEVFKDYHIDSNRFKEFQKDNSDYISFIEG